MNLAEAIEKYGNVELPKEVIQKLKSHAQPKSVWDLKTDHEYYWLDNDGYIQLSTWICCQEDMDRRDFGNVFLTKEEAETELERRRVEALLLKYGGKKDFNRGYCNQFIIYTPIDKELSRYATHASPPQGSIYFASSEDLDYAVSKIGKKKNCRRFFWRSCMKTKTKYLCRSHIDGVIYTRDTPPEDDDSDLYCDICRDWDEYLGVAHNAREAWDLAREDDDPDIPFYYLLGSGRLEYIFEDTVFYWEDHSDFPAYDYYLKSRRHQDNYELNQTDDSLKQQVELEAIKEICEFLSISYYQTYSPRHGGQIIKFDKNIERS